MKKNQVIYKYINNPTEEMCYLSVKGNPYNIQWIKNPSEEVQLEVVNKEPLCIKFIENPTEKVQLIALNKDVRCISDIKNPTENAQLYVISCMFTPPYYRDYFFQINNPTDNAILTWILKGGDYKKLYVDNMSDELANKIYNILVIKDILE